MLTWLNVADLGLSNGLTNRLSEAYGSERQDLAQRYVATTFWLLVAVACAIGGLIAIGWQWSNWSAVFNIKSLQAQAEVGPALMLAIMVSLVSFPLSIVQKIFRAYQESTVADMWQAVGQVASLVALVLVTRTQGGLVRLVAAVSVSTVVTIVSAIWLFWRHKPWLIPRPTAIRRHSIQDLGTLGGMFFVAQIAGLLVYQTDNLIIAHYLGSRQVTPYSVAWRLFSYTNLLQILVSASLWPAYAEAFARNDGPWIKRTYRLHLAGGTLSALLFTVPLVAFGSHIIRAWAGPEAVPSFALLAWLGVWSVINASMDVTACILNGCGRMKWQMYYGMLAALVNIGLSITFVTRFGLAGVIAATVVAFLTCAVIPSFFETEYLLKRLAAQFTKQNPVPVRI
ncbi:MAG: hypothetical protein NVS2B7_16020 [Herpetosiphon sp.]